MADKKPPVTKRELSANNYVAAVAVGSVLILIVTGIVGKFLIDRVVLNTKVINKKMTAVRDLKTKKENAPKLIQEYKDLGAKETLIMNGLPTTGDFPQVVAIMDGIAATAGVKIDSISPGGNAVETEEIVDGVSKSSSSTDAPEPQESAFQIQVTGPYDRVMAMLKGLEQSARPMRVGTMQFTGSASALVSQLELTTYHQDEADITDKTEVIE